MDDNTIDFINLSNLKSQLICLDREELIDLYQDDYESYITFLNSVGILINEEVAFLLFNDEYIDKILTVNQVYRFSSQDSEVKDLINEIILAANQLKALSDAEKYSLMYEYVEQQEYLRDTSFYDADSFIDAINFDSYLIYNLQEGNTEKLYDGDNELYLMSINYILNACPAFFDDLEIQDMTIEKLEDMAGPFGRRRIGIQESLERFKNSVQKVLKKGE